LELDASGSLTVVRATGERAKIEAILESWRIDDEWWRQPIARSYMNVLLEGGRRVVLFQDLYTGLWFLQQP